MVFFGGQWWGEGGGKNYKGPEVLETPASPTVLAVPDFDNARGCDSYWTIRPASPRAGGSAFISVCGQGQGHGGQHPGWLMSNWDPCLATVLGHALGWPWRCSGRPHSSWSLGQSQEAIFSVTSATLQCNQNYVPPTPPSLKCLGLGYLGKVIPKAFLLCSPLVTNKRELWCNSGFHFNHQIVLPLVASFSTNSENLYKFPSRDSGRKPLRGQKHTFVNEYVILIFLPRVR